MNLCIALDLSYYRRKEGVWEGEGKRGGKSRCKRRLRLGVQMSGSARGHAVPSLSRFQPRGMLKSWSNSRDWTYSYFRCRRANVQPWRPLQGTARGEELRASKATSPWPRRMEGHSDHPPGSHFPFATEIPVLSNREEP